MPGGRGLAQDVLDVLLKTHRKHLVALIEHNTFNPVELQGAAPNVVENTSRRSADDLGASAELFDLPSHGRATVYGNDHKLRGGTDARRFSCDLQGQLSCGQQHQGLGEEILGVCDPVSEGDGEGCCLARTGSRLHEDVATFARLGDGFALDIHGLDKAHVRDCLEHFWPEAKVGEGCFRRSVARGLRGLNRRGTA